MKVAIASGKGGTGKSTISTNLAYLLSKEVEDIVLLDCDVEEPNCHIFLKPKFSHQEEVFVPVPEIDTEKCIKCGKCAEVCQYNALAFVKDKVLKFEELCHGCGNCFLACPSGAISESGRKVGDVESGFSKGFNFIHGVSRIGEAMSPPLIKSVKNLADENNYSLQILDCPPGTSCPVIAAVDGVDFVIMVTEPTPFGLYDLKLAVDVMRKIGLPFGVVINRSSENDSLIQEYAQAENIKILTKIPDDRRVAECYSRGDLMVEALPDYEKAFEPLIELIKERM